MLELLLINYVVAALSGLLVGSISVTLTTSRSITFGLTLLHSILGGNLLGVYLSSLYNLTIPIPLVSTLTAIALSIIVGELIERGLSEDMAIAFSVSIATTMTIIFGYLASQVSSLAITKAWTYIAGTSSISSIEDLAKLTLTLFIVLPIVHLLFKEFKYIAFDEDGAKALGLNIRFYRYVFYSLAALSASILSSTIGILATHVVLSVPGIIYIKFFKRYNIAFSYLIGVVIMLVGYYLASLLSISPSGGVGLTSILTVLGVTVYGRRS
ncbi:MAG: metal ABC transporter permease [Aigarchaeota archaeon]|nr:metal ABC transporter permease [Aigarchaeota archaeon]MCX8193243.1 metal ABC transporter permease [Nitrososphaeria archaeon]MDW7986383.1 iron chelate uptake ABC transporter family permease subunit [Nitrososphaerota archaeon]